MTAELRGRVGMPRSDGTNRPGYGATLYKDVASASFDSSPCTNPTG
jgi:hypothetical protein